MFKEDGIDEPATAPGPPLPLRGADPPRGTGRLCGSHSGSRRTRGAREGASVWHHAVLRGDLNRIVVGPRSNIQDGCVLHVTEELEVQVEEDVTVGHGAILHGCRIGRGCLVAMRAVVLDGAVVGAGSIVAAGAIVPEGAVIPPGSVVMGIPGRVVRPTREGDREKLAFLASSYVDLAKRYDGLR